MRKIKKRFHVRKINFAVAWHGFTQVDTIRMINLIFKKKFHEKNVGKFCISVVWSVYHIFSSIIIKCTSNNFLADTYFLYKMFVSRYSFFNLTTLLFASTWNEREWTKCRVYRQTYITSSTKEVSKGKSSFIVRGGTMLYLIRTRILWCRWFL